MKGINGIVVIATTIILAKRLKWQAFPFGVMFALAADSDLSSLRETAFTWSTSEAWQQITLPAGNFNILASVLLWALCLIICWNELTRPSGKEKAAT